MAHWHQCWGLLLCSPTSMLGRLLLHSLSPILEVIATTDTNAGSYCTPNFFSVQCNLLQKTQHDRNIRALRCQNCPWVRCPLEVAGPYLRPFIILKLTTTELRPSKQQYITFLFWFQYHVKYLFSIM